MAGIYILFLFVVLLLPQLYPVTAVSVQIRPGSYYIVLTRQTTLNYAPICIGIVTIVSLVGWILPFGLGGRYWFKGPKKTIEMDESRQAVSNQQEEPIHLQ